MHYRVTCGQCKRFHWCGVVLEVHFQWLLVLLAGHTDRVVGSSSTTSPSSTSSTASTLWLPRCQLLRHRRRHALLLLLRGLLHHLLQPCDLQCLLTHDFLQ